jgi:methionine sulfoxide reductase heme-binding subunit
MIRVVILFRGIVLSKEADGKEKGHKSDKGMADKKISNKQFYLIYGIILVIVLFIAYLLLQRPGEPLRMVARFAATFGYLTIFLSILSSEYMAKMRKISGLPYLKAHHHLARIGILLILIHPLSIALEVQDFRVFLPVFYPIEAFLALGGRTALYLFLLAAGIALYRKKYKSWRKVHYLSYLAFLLVSAHALLIGTDFESGIMRMLALVMAVAATGIFIHKRSASRQKRR